MMNRAATTLGVRFFVVGAMARDIVFEYCYAIRPARGTRDLDIGVDVSGWEVPIGPELILLLDQFYASVFGTTFFGLV